MERTPSFEVVRAAPASTVRAKRDENGKLVKARVRDMVRDAGEA